MFKNLALFFLITSLSTSLTFGQYKKEVFLLKGTISGVPDGTSILLASNSRKANDWTLSTDSSKILNGQFYFKGTLSYPHGVRVFYDAANKYFSSKLFFIDKGVQILNINIDSIKKYTPEIQGSKANSIYLKKFHVREMEQEELSLSEKAQQLYNKYKNDMPENEVMKFREKQNEYYNKKDSILLKSTISSTNFISMWLANDYLFGNGYKPLYQKVFNLMPDYIKKSKTGSFFKAKLTEANSTRTGAGFPTLNLFNSDSTSHLIAFNNGQAKYTLIDFWFSYCGPCIAQFESLKGIYKNFNKVGFQIIGISVDAKKDKTNG